MSVRVTRARPSRLVLVLVLVRASRGCTGQNGLGMATAGCVFQAVTGKPFVMLGGEQRAGLSAKTARPHSPC